MGMDRDTIMEQLEPHEILLFMRLQKTASEAVDIAVDKWSEGHEVLQELYKNNPGTGEKKVLDLLVQTGITKRDKELRELSLCITRVDTLRTNISEPSDES